MDIIRDDSSKLDLIKYLQREIIDRKWAEKKANDALDYAESIIDSVKSPLIVLDDEYKVISANLPFFELFGLSIETGIGKKFFELEKGLFDIVELKKLIFSDCVENQSIQFFQDFEIVGKKFLEIKCVNLQYNIKHLKFKLVIINDITELINTQKALEKTVNEKQFLINEIQHRVKNNLYLIESVLNLEMDSLKSQESIKAFNSTIKRIHCLGLLYEKLYRAKEKDDVSIKSYLSELISSMNDLFDKNISIKIDEKFEDFYLNGKVLFIIGLIINELITNAMKYAFIEKDSGQIRISSNIKDDTIKLIVQDNGVGISESINGNKTDTFGVQLLNMLSSQIDGKLSIEDNDGTKCTIQFKKDQINKIL